MAFEAFSVFVPMGLTDTPDVADDLLAKSRDVGTPSVLRGGIGGIVSTEARDYEGEKVNQKGMDFSYFLRKGWFNWEHQPGPENVLGEPTNVSDVMVDGVPGKSVEGFLYLGRPRAAAVYETANAMRKAQTDRKLGYSVEGQVLFRNPKNRKDVERSRVFNVTITAHPQNPWSGLELLAKSMTIGHMTPASGGGTLGALVPQSMDRTTLTTLGLQMGREGLSVEDFAKRVAEQFGIQIGAARRFADTIARHVRAQ